MRLLNVCVSALSVVLPLAAQARFEKGITSTELAALAHALPNIHVLNLRIFREGSNSRLSAAVLTEVAHVGWRVLIVSPSTPDAYKVSWKSEPLKDSFAVSSPNELSTFGLAHEEAVTFSGCAAHACPDVFSVLLYVPSLHRALTATCTYKQTKYSFESASPDAQFRGDLNQLLRNQLTNTDACAKEIREDGNGL